MEVSEVRYHNARAQPVGGGRTVAGFRSAAKEITIASRRPHAAGCSAESFELARKLARNHLIRKTPANIIAIIFVTPARGMNRADASRFVPLMHGIQL